MDMNNYYGAAVGSFSFKGLRERFSRKVRSKILGLDLIKQL